MNENDMTNHVAILLPKRPRDQISFFVKNDFNSEGIFKISENNLVTKTNREYTLLTK